MKAEGSVAACPSGFVTVTGTLPWECAGATAVRVVGLNVETPAAVVPKVTLAPASKPDPCIVTRVPPEVEPFGGVRLTTAGAER